MIRLTLVLTVFAAVILVGLAQCDKEPSHEPAEPVSQVFFLNITSGAEEDVHAVTMALQLAGHALDDGRDVVLFFNVRGAGVPTVELPADLAFKDKPIKELLTALIERGAEVHVCPHCMTALELEPGDLVEGALVTDREKLFSKVGMNTVVFSY